VGNLDEGHKSTGLLIVSGGNEIRAGAHAGMAKLAQLVAAEGYPVFRYDRRGIGDSGGTNAGFMASAADIAAASEHFRKVNPKLDKVVGFGNCDAATALVLFTEQAKLNALILANPWVIDEANDDTEIPTTPAPSWIRARYW
jgi:alpha/beta superfamily hydrolase